MLFEMGLRTALWLALAVLPAGAQVLGSQSLSGKYYFRHLSLGATDQGGIANLRSLYGSVTFNGAGRYSFTAQQLNGTTAPVAQSGSGAYSVDPAGFVSMDNPLRAGAQINARLGAEALVGSSTESADNAFDLWVAIPAPSTAPALAGPFRTVSLEFPEALASNVRSSFFSLNPAGAGRLADFTVTGHAANIAGGAPVTQQVANPAYQLNADGSGTFSFGSYNTAVLFSGNRTFYASASGNIIIGGGSDTHDILIGVKSATGTTNASWNGNYWGAGLRFNTFAPAVDVSGYSAAAVVRGAGTLTWTKRIKALGFGAFDFTGVNAYSLKNDGSGTLELSQVGLGTGGRAFVSTPVSTSDPTAYEITFGVQMTPLTGSGVFLNPQGVLSAASFAPTGNPISPGEFIALYGTGLASTTATALPPYPNSLAGVTVSINGRPAPLYYVSPTEIDCLVPYATTGSTATIVVQNGANSNTVTVPVAATSPSVFTMNRAGTGAGAILHADYSLVSAEKPAAAGETVVIYLTGMGAVSPAVADGVAGGTSPLNNTAVPLSQISVLFGGVPGRVIYSGLAPGYPGLYQINVTLPAVLPAKGVLPLAIQTPNAFHDQADIQVQ